MSPATDAYANPDTAAGSARADTKRLRSNIEVLIITFNEAANLPHALESVLTWADAVYIVDSGSTDGTQDIARKYGATVIHHDWPGYARQKNWALETLPIKSDWVFILDADESITPELRDELLTLAAKPIAEIPQTGFYVNRLTKFMGKPIRHAGYFPSYNLRFFRRGMAHYEDREVHEHMVIDGDTRRLRHYMLHEDRRGLEHFIAKHNRYSTLEARELMRARARSKHESATKLERGIAMRRWLKLNVLPRLGLIGFWRFLYMYFIRLGFLDGLTGFRFCLLLAACDTFISLKLAELRSIGADRNANVLVNPKNPVKGLAVPEGDFGAVPIGVVADAAQPTDVQPAPAPATPLHTTNGQQQTPDPRGKPLTREDAIITRATSPYTISELIRRTLWDYIGQTIFRITFHNWYSIRSMLLRFAGAKVGKRVRVRPSVRFELPWNLTIGDDSTIGDRAIVYCVGPVTIGKRVSISQMAHLCAGSHDYTREDLPLLRPPITIGDDVWIAADAFVGPNVTIGNGCVVGARSNVMKSLPEWTVCAGAPAKPLKERKLGPAFARARGQ